MEDTFGRKGKQCDLRSPSLHCTPMLRVDRAQRRDGTRTACRGFESDLDLRWRTPSVAKESSATYALPRCTALPRFAWIVRSEGTSGRKEKQGDLRSPSLHCTPTLRVDRAQRRDGTRTACRGFESDLSSAKEKREVLPPFFLWRRTWDSNPRGCYTLLAFQASSLATRSILQGLN